MNEPVKDVSATLGVMGGGQLARMFVHAAQSMGFRTAVLDPDPASPAGLVSHQHLCCAYLDPVGLEALAAACDAVTTEFENVPVAALERLAARRPVAPGADAVRVCQDRLREKAHFIASGVPCAPHKPVVSLADASTVHEDLFPAILKTAQLGYDGKGQASVQAPAQLAAAWQAMGGVPCVLEKKLPLALEISVVVARGVDGQMVHLPVQQNLHRGGILAVTQAPAPDVPAHTAEQAVACARQLAHGLGYVGVLCVEFFVLADGTLVANEMAPRPHNSGHHSIDSCDVSQFELQVRAMAGLPLVMPRQHSPTVMLNLLGDLWPPPGAPSALPPQGGAAGGPAEPDPRRPLDQGPPDWRRVLAMPGVHLHLYGKTEARPGRKMGHLTITGESPEAARRVALEAAAALGFAPF